MSSRQGHHLVARLEDAARPGDDLLPGGGERNVVGLPLDELHAQVLLQLLQLRRKRRLADEAALGRPAEVAGIRHGDQVAQVFQFDVGHRQLRQKGVKRALIRYMASIEIIKSIHWINDARGTHHRPRSHIGTRRSDDYQELTIC